ncbi:MAG: hypothetical protein HC913_17010 [Microscillaceae bacterium]|nr:hypothetical protein [Microscillaceae bacterium]
METGIDYRGAIQAEIQHIPEEYLAHLYQIILLLAQSFKEKDPELVPQVEKPPFPLAVIEAYVHSFRESFELIMKEHLHLEARYKQVNDEMILIQWIETADKEIPLSEISDMPDLPQLVKENEKDYDVFLRLIKHHTQILFTEQDIIFCKSLNEAYWTQEQAQADSRDLFGALVPHMPKYKEEVHGVG